jgi:DNA-binding response OmpR family regulator
LCDDRQERGEGSSGRLTLENHRSLIMVIDNNSGIREFYCAELSEQGYEVIATGEFSRAAEMIEKSKPDLVLIDPFTEGENRWDVLADIKNGIHHVPVLLCLAFAVDDNSSLLALADGCVIKSSCTADLISKVELLLKRCSPKEHDKAD